MGTGVVASDATSAAAIAAALGYTPNAQQDVQNLSPTAGQTISMTDNSVDGLLWLTPAGTLATLTVNFPSDANSRIGQVRSVGSSKQITAITLSNATFFNTVSTIALGECYSFQKVAANTWVRIL